MIDFVREQRLLLPDLDLATKGSTHLLELNEVVEALSIEYLEVASQYGIQYDRSFNDFYENMQKVVLDFLSRGLDLRPVFPENGEEERPEPVFSLDCFFPSTACYPILEYVVNDRRFGFPYEPICPYSVLVNIVRNKGITNDHDRNFAYNLVHQMNRKGVLEGERIVERKDVKIFKRVLREFLT